MKVTSEAGGAAIGGQLRRLSETIDRDVERAYKAFGVKFEQRWFGVLVQLIEKGPATVGQLAESLGITHVSVSQTRKSLHKAGLIAYELSPTDGRKRLIKLTEKGYTLADQIRPLWDAMLEVGMEINSEAENLVERLDKLETALKQKSIFERVTVRLDLPTD